MHLTINMQMYVLINKALNCIQSVTKAETQDLVPYKKEIINGLTPALDDHKRLVRQAATSARNSWCLS